MKHLFIKDHKRRIKFAQNEKKRIILKFLLNNTALSMEQRLLLNEKLQKLNKKTNNTKINNRCSITYRGRSNLSIFKLSRIRLRELISLGLVPGYKKAVW
jgi:small subunit ribosomal protein S14